MTARANFLLLSALLIAGCAEHQAKAPAAMPPPIVSAPAPQPAAPGQPDWNIFPDPITGRVEIYRDGVHLGSVTGNEDEDPPVPQKRGNTGTDSD